jgi:undecaprenyl-diphosphatase
VNLVRVYCGYHFPSDIIGGAMLGMIAILAAYPLRELPTIQSALTVPPRFEPLFYAVTFYALFGIATLWDDWRHIVSGLCHYLHHAN